MSSSDKDISKVHHSFVAAKQQYSTIMHIDSDISHLNILSNNNNNESNKISESITPFDTINNNNLINNHWKYDSLQHHYDHLMQPYGGNNAEILLNNGIEIVADQNRSSNNSSNVNGCANAGGNQNSLPALTVQQQQHQQQFQQQQLHQVQPINATTESGVRLFIIY